MILTYAGRRATALGDHVDQVAERIRRRLAELRPSAVVGAAADGADLLILEAALAAEARPRIHVVLPTSRETFAQDSVEPAWRHRLHAVLAEVEAPGNRGSVLSLGLAPGEAAYRTANEQFLDTARMLGGTTEDVALLIVAHQGEGQLVEHLLGLARSRGVPVERIDPST